MTQPYFLMQVSDYVQHWNTLCEILTQYFYCTSSVYFAFLGLTPDPTVTLTKLWIHGMYNV